MRKLRLSEIKYHGHTILTDHTAKWQIKICTQVSLYQSLYWVHKGLKKRGGKWREDKLESEGKQEVRKSWALLPSRPCSRTRASARTNCHCVVFQLITPWHQQVLICEKKTMTLKGSWRFLDSNRGFPKHNFITFGEKWICFLQRQSLLPDILIYKWTENECPALGWTPDIRGRK